MIERNIIVEIDMDAFYEAFDNGEIIIDGRHMTEDDHKETSRKIAELKAMRQDNKVKEFVA